MKRVLSLLLLSLLVVVPASSAQAPPQGPAQAQPQGPRQGGEPPRPTIGTAAGSSPRNIRFDIVISDTGVTGPITKTVTLNVTQGGTGSIRSTAVTGPAQRPAGQPAGEGRGNPNPQPVGPASISLNVDVNAPTIFEDGGIRAILAIEYQPYVTPTAGRPMPAVVRANSMSVFQTGQKMVVLQAADPVTDRRTTIEVTATVLR